MSFLVAALIPFATSCADDYVGQSLLCEIGGRESLDFNDFLVSLDTGAVITGLEDVCCDRALTMELLSNDKDDQSFRASYRTTHFGYVKAQWEETLTIDLSIPGKEKPFELTSAAYDLTGNCTLRTFALIRK